LLCIKWASSLLTVGADHIENGWVSGDPSTSACERQQ